MRYLCVYPRNEVGKLHFDNTVLDELFKYKAIILRLIRLLIQRWRYCRFSFSRIVFDLNCVFIFVHVFLRFHKVRFFFRPYI